MDCWHDAIERAREFGGIPDERGSNVGTETNEPKSLKTAHEWGAVGGKWKGEACEDWVERGEWCGSEVDTSSQKGLQRTSRRWKRILLCQYWQHDGSSLGPAHWVASLRCLALISTRLMLAKHASL